MSRLATIVYFWPVGLLSIALILAGWSEAAAQEPTAVRVEEDWELVVGDPDLITDAPQVICVLSPQGDVSGIYGAFETNARSIPEFVAGGLQLQVWEGDTALSDRRHPNGLLLQQSGERVCWTQSMALDDGTLVFEITNGSSSTWGSFGGEGYLKATVDTALQNLNGYNPVVSVQNSGVSFAANRVSSLVLKRVRIEMSDGQVLEDNAERVVYSQAAE